MKNEFQASKADLMAFRAAPEDLRANSPGLQPGLVECEEGSPFGLENPMAP